VSDKGRVSLLQDWSHRHWKKHRRSTHRFGLTEIPSLGPNLPLFLIFSKSCCFVKKIEFPSVLLQFPLRKGHDKDYLFFTKSGISFLEDFPRLKSDCKSKICFWNWMIYCISFSWYLCQSSAEASLILSAVSFLCCVQFLAPGTVLGTGRRAMDVTGTELALPSSRSWKGGNVRHTSYKQVLLMALVGIMKEGTRAEKEYHGDLNMAWRVLWDWQVCICMYV